MQATLFQAIGKTHNKIKNNNNDNNDYHMQNHTRIIHETERNLISHVSRIISRTLNRQSIADEKLKVVKL